MTSFGESFAKVFETLPRPSKDLSITDGARSMLALVLRPESQRVSDESSHPADPTRCPNCDRLVESVKSPYCGGECREIAGFVRQVRSGVLDESLLVPDRQIALGQILWQILGGGLPLRNSLIEPKALARLMTKYEGRCTACGAAATTVDHIGSFCNRTSNLRPMCDACARTRPFGAPEVLARPAVEALRAELARRIGTPLPVRCCDDATSWDWRAYIKRRKSCF